jgi:hypothetical protein
MNPPQPNTPSKGMVAIAAICVAVLWLIVAVLIEAFLTVTIMAILGWLPWHINLGRTGGRALISLFVLFFLCGALWIAMALSLHCPHCGFKFLKNPKSLGPTGFVYHPNRSGQRGFNGWAVQIFRFLTSGKMSCINCGEEIFIGSR